MSEVILRVATEADIPMLAVHRAKMFEEMGTLPASGFPALMQKTSHYLQAHLRESYFAWVLEHEGNIIGSGGYQIRHSLPRPGQDGSILGDHIQPIILGMWVDAPFRRQGHARRIMDAIIADCRAKKYPSVVLHASEAGRPLYLSLGFVLTNELGLWLGPGVDTKQH